jgi:hypothetical protein
MKNKLYVSQYETFMERINEPVVIIDDNTTQKKKNSVGVYYS